MNMINGLPDEIISHILSFLPFKEAASTSVLSKRWRYLFAFRPTLHFDDHELGLRGQSFIDFVDRILDMFGSNIRKFSMKCRMMRFLEYHLAHVTRWIIEVFKRGALNLDIDATFYEVRIRVPLEVFTCKRMVELKLANGFEFMIPEDVSLPSLKTLFLDSIWFHNCDLEKLLSACPALEELTIRIASWETIRYCRTISSSTLKKLTFLFFGHHWRFIFWDMTLYTPRLTYLEYSDAVPKDYPIVNLESLVEAKLNLRSCHGISNPTSLIKGLLNVEILELSSVATTETFWVFREAIPVFNNLFRLSITVDNLYFHYGLLQILLKNSPKLHTLVIKGRVLYFNSNEQEYGLSCPVKVLKITEFGGDTVELRQMKHFLEKLSSLELVEVRAYAISDKEKFQITKDLLMVPRSSNCNIRIKFCEKTKGPLLVL